MTDREDKGSPPLRSGPQADGLPAQRHLWVLMLATGEYSEREEIPIGVFADEAFAKRQLTKVDEFYRAVVSKWNLAIDAANYNTLDAWNTIAEKDAFFALMGWSDDDCYAPYSKHGFHLCEVPFDQRRSAEGVRTEGPDRAVGTPNNPTP